MPFQQISAPSLRELFVQQLEGLILSGELRPGDHLPTERELADEMKISKTVVHEGLRDFILHSPFKVVLQPGNVLRRRLLIVL